MMIESNIVGPELSARAASILPRGFRKQFRWVLLLFPMALLLGFAPLAQAGAITSEETLMQAMFNEAAGLDYLSPGLATLNYAFVVNTNTGSFSYASLPGQTFEGVAFSVSGMGTYDAISNTYDWTASGYLGPSTWAEQGEMEWTGDPNANVSGSVSLNGTVIGSISGTVDVDGMGHSSGTVAYTPNGGTPNPMSVTDFVPGAPGPWTFYWNGHDAQVAISGEWVETSDSGGIDTGTASIELCPECGSFFYTLLGWAAGGGAMLLRSRSRSGRFWAS
jgi:hypothetical protein